VTVAVTPDSTRFGTADARATVAEVADQLLTPRRLVEFAVRGIPGAEHAGMTVVDDHRPARATLRRPAP
jgi:hypothetical protein